MKKYVLFLMIAVIAVFASCSGCNNKPTTPETDDSTAVTPPVVTIKALSFYTVDVFKCEDGDAFIPVISDLIVADSTVNLTNGMYYRDSLDKEYIYYVKAPATPLSEDTAPRVVLRDAKSIENKAELCKK